MARLSIPTVHLNGTSRDGLMKPLMAAVEALQLAIDAVQQACPNGRDYYVQSDGAIKEALRQHGTRVQALAEVRTELYEIAEQIDAQPGRRS